MREKTQSYKLIEWSLSGVFCVHILYFKILSKIVFMWTVKENMITILSMMMTKTGMTLTTTTTMKVATTTTTTATAKLRLFIQVHVFMAWNFEDCSQRTLNISFLLTAVRVL